MFEPQEITRTEAENIGYKWPLYSKVTLFAVFMGCVGMGVIFGMVSFKAIFCDISSIVASIMQ